MVYDIVHDLRKNNVEEQVFFVVHACTKSLHKAHEILCTKIPNSSSPAIMQTHIIPLLRKNTSDKNILKTSTFIPLSIYPFQSFEELKYAFVQQ